MIDLSRVKNLPLDCTDPIWGYPPLPSKFAKFRDWQIPALEQIMNAYASGAKIVMVEAPPGSGKSVLGEAVRRLLGVRGIYLAETFDLQEQMTRDFQPYAVELRGRRNYPTINFPHLFRDRWNPLSCAECTKQKINSGNELDSEESEEITGGKWHCDYCEPVSACKYEVQKYRTLAADLAILNYSYALTEWNLPGGGKFSNSAGLVICDEADRIEAVLLGHASVEISGKMMAELGIEPPSHRTKSDKTDTEVWPAWVRETAIPAVTNAARKHSGEDIRDIRKRNTFIRLLKKLYNLADELPKKNYVYDGWNFGGSVIFKPIHVDRLANELLWPHADRWLLMSGTFLEPHEPMDSLGITEEQCPLPDAYVVMPWTFPVANRPIAYRSDLAVDMSNKHKETAWPEMTEGIAQVMAERKTERILIHTVSYKLAEFLMDNLGNHLPKSQLRRLITYGRSSERQEALELYKETPGAVLIAPSLERGVSLDNEWARVIVVCKIPRPNIGDKQIAARMWKTGGRLWYAVQTIRTLIQMTGRGVRHKNDYCEVIILDKVFYTEIWRKWKHLLPQGWVDALDYGSRKFGIWFKK